MIIIPFKTWAYWLYGFPHFRVSFIRLYAEANAGICQFKCSLTTTLHLKLEQIITFKNKGVK